MTVRSTFESIRSALHAVGPGEIDDMVSDLQLCIQIPAEAAAADVADYILFEAQDHTYALLSATTITSGAVGIDAVNTSTLTLSTEDGLAGGLVARDALTNAAVAWVARVPRDFTIDPATDVLAIGDVLVLAVTKAVAGTQMPDMLVRVTLRITD